VQGEGYIAGLAAMPQLDTTFEQLQLRNTPQEVLVYTRRLVFGNRWVGATAGLWLVGLLVAFVLPPPVPITPEKLQVFEEKMFEVHAAEKRLGEIENEYLAADSMYRAEAVRVLDQNVTLVQVWHAVCNEYHDGTFTVFSGFLSLVCVARAEASALTLPRPARSAAGNDEFRALEPATLTAECKQLGLFSAHGIDQVKSRFWCAPAALTCEVTVS
jgi:hypothetical protein